MAAQFFALCVSALLIQSIAAQSCGCGKKEKSATKLDCGLITGAEIAAAELLGADIAAANLGRFSYAPAYIPAPYYSAPASIYSGPAYAAKSGGAFGVSVASPNAPSGVSVLSENSIDGVLEVAGSLPVLAGVAFEGTVPSAGAAGTAYSCGCGEVGIATESLAANNIGIGSAALAGAAFAEAELAGLARRKFARPACGCY